MTPLLVAACALGGVGVGSFLAAVVDSVPRRRPLRAPWQRCRTCPAPLGRRGSLATVRPAPDPCPDCGARRRGRDALVEGLTAVLFALAAARFGLDWALPAFLLFFAVLVAVTVIDAEHFIVPNRVLVPGLAVAVPLLAVAALLGGEWARFGGALLGAAVAFNALLLVHVVNPRGMGAGDVKLAALLGLFLGWLGLDHVVLGLFLGFLLGAAVGLALVALRLRRRQDHVPFAPFLAAGAVLAVVAGGPLLAWYTGL